MLRTAMFRTIGIAALALVTSSAFATLYNGSYTVSANGNPAVGLAVMTINDFGSFVTPTTNSFIGLNVPATGLHFTDLFELFALESSPFTGNDLVPQPINVTFNFTSPSAASGAITGTTVGILNDDALLHWNGPINLVIAGGNLRITLLDTTFSDFFNGVVTAQFAQFVPEPGTLALLGIGLLGAFGRRKRTGLRY
jgi:hypothetical protein